MLKVTPINVARPPRPWSPTGRMSVPQQSRLKWPIRLRRFGQPGDRPVYSSSTEPSSLRISSLSIF